MLVIKEMANFELSRWYALFEAVNLLADECDERGKDFESLNLEPLHLRKYIEKTCDLYGKKLLEEQEQVKTRAELRMKHLIKDVKVSEVVNDLHN
jgi:hypothetical protein